MTDSDSRRIQVFGCDTNEMEIEAVQKVLKSQWLGMGKKVSAFERQFSIHGGLENFLMVDSGSNALYLALKLLDLPPKSEIVLPSFTWIACANAIILAGHTPIFCDVEPDTFNVSSATVSSCLSRKTGAIMVVHFAGHPVDLDPIKEFGFPIIEDAAHAADAWYRGKLCGSIGDIGIYSFNSVKNIATGGGGGITMKQSLHRERAQQLRYSGIGESGYDASVRNHFPWWEYQISEPFIKMLPSDLNAAIAIEQLAKLKAHQLRRREIWNRYQEELRDLNWLVLPKETPLDWIHGFFTFVAKIINGKRNQLARYLLEKGIYTTVRYTPLHHFPIFEHSGKSLPQTDALYRETLCFPLHPSLKESEVDYIISSIRSFE